MTEEGETMLKPGVKSSEFVAVLIFAIGALASSLADQLQPKWAAIAISVATAAYAVSRGIAKHGAALASVPPTAQVHVTPASQVTVATPQQPAA